MVLALVIYLNSSLFNVASFTIIISALAYSITKLAEKSLIIGTSFNSFFINSDKALTGDIDLTSTMTAKDDGSSTTFCITTYTDDFPMSVLTLMLPLSTSSYAPHFSR